MHDLPPPTMFYDGSLTIELKDELKHPVPPPPAGGRWLHKSVPPPPAQPPYIAAVRVLKGNGDTIYQDTDAANTVIVIELQDSSGESAGNLTITGNATSFQIDADQKLGGPNTGHQGRESFLHPGKGNPFHISKIKIDKAVPPISHFEVNAPTDYEEEYRIMIWHEGHVHTAAPGSPSP
jgi:hypothetical protein